MAGALHRPGDYIAIPLIVIAIGGTVDARDMGRGKMGRGGVRTSDVRSGNMRGSEIAGREPAR